MKICWDNLEGFYLTRGGNFKRPGEGNIYYEHDACIVCGDPFLGTKDSEFCTQKCGYTSEITKQKHKEASSGENNGMFNKKHSSDAIKKMQNARKKALVLPENNPNFKGGYCIKNISTYDGFASQLEPYEQCRRQEEDPNILEVKCAYCGKWHSPEAHIARNRVNAINKNGIGAFYCSPECKIECPIFRKVKYSADHPKSGKKRSLTIEVPPELRQMVFERDNHICQRCGSTKSLHCHHIIPKKLDPMILADLYNCITLCKECHKWVHMNIPGCGYGELATMERC